MLLVACLIFFKFSNVNSTDVLGDILILITSKYICQKIEC